MTIGTLAARILADASGVRSGMGMTRDELKLTRQAFVDSTSDVDKMNVALAQLESARGKGAFQTEEQYAAAVKAVRAELDPMAIAQQRATAEQEKATSAALQSRNALREQIATHKMSADQIAIWKLQQQGVDPILVSNIAKLQQHRAAQVADSDATTRGKQITESVRTPLELQSRAIRELNQLLTDGKITQETHTRAVQQSNQALNAGAGVAARYGAVASSAIRSVAGAFGVTLGFTGVVYGFRSAIQGAERFEQAMASSTAIILDLTTQQRTAFEQTAQQVAYQTKFSAEEAAKAYYFLASAGLDASQTVKALPVVATFAQAGMFDLAQATDLLTDAQMALGMAYKDPIRNQAEMIRLGDALVKGNILANASVEQLSTSLTSGAGAALKMVNKSVEEGVAILAAFASQGEKGESAGTALNIVFRDMQTKAIENASVWKQNNVAVFDATGKMRNFADILKDLETRLDGASDKQKKMTLAELGFADKSVMYTQMLLGQSDAIRDYEAKLREAGGTMEDVADRQMPPLTKMTNQLKAEWEAFSIAFAKPIVSSLSSQTAEVGALATALATVLSIQDRLGAFKDMAKYLPEKLLLEGEIRDIKMQLRLNPSPENKARLKTELRGYEAQLDESMARFDKAWNRYSGAEDAGDKYIEQLKEMRQELDITAGKTGETAKEVKENTASGMFGGAEKRVQELAKAAKKAADEATATTKPPDTSAAHAALQAFELSEKGLAAQTKMTSAELKAQQEDMRALSESTQSFADALKAVQTSSDADVSLIDDLMKDVREYESQLRLLKNQTDPAAMAELAARGITAQQAEELEAMKLLIGEKAKTAEQIAATEERFRQLTKAERDKELADKIRAAGEEAKLAKLQADPLERIKLQQRGITAEQALELARLRQQGYEVAGLEAAWKSAKQAKDAMQRTDTTTDSLSRAAAFDLIRQTQERDRLTAAANGEKPDPTALRGLSRQDIERAQRIANGSSQIARGTQKDGEKSNEIKTWERIAKAVEAMAVKEGVVIEEVKL